MSDKNGQNIIVGEGEVSPRVLGKHGSEFGAPGTRSTGASPAGPSSSSTTRKTATATAARPTIAWVAAYSDRCSSRRPLQLQKPASSVTVILWFAWERNGVIRGARSSTKS